MTARLRQKILTRKLNAFYTYQVYVAVFIIAVILGLTLGLRNRTTQNTSVENSLTSTSSLNVPIFNYRPNEIPQVHETPLFQGVFQVPNDIDLYNEQRNFGITSVNNRLEQNLWTLFGLSDNNNNSNNNNFSVQVGSLLTDDMSWTTITSSDRVFSSLYVALWNESAHVFRIFQQNTQGWRPVTQNTNFFYTQPQFVVVTSKLYLAALSTLNNNNSELVFFNQASDFEQAVFTLSLQSNVFRWTSSFDAQTTTLAMSNQTDSLSVYQGDALSNLTLIKTLLNVHQGIPVLSLRYLAVYTPNNNAVSLYLVNQWLLKTEILIVLSNPNAGLLTASNDGTILCLSDGFTLPRVWQIDQNSITVTSEQTLPTPDFCSSVSNNTARNQYVITRNNQFWTWQPQQ